MHRNTGDIYRGYAMSHEMAFEADFHMDFYTQTRCDFLYPKESVGWEKSVIINECVDTLIRDSRVFSRDLDTPLCVTRRAWSIVYSFVPNIRG